MIILLKNSSYFNEMQITLDNRRVEKSFNEYAIEQIKIFTIIKRFDYLNR